MTRRLYKAFREKRERMTAYRDENGERPNVREEYLTERTAARESVRQNSFAST